ncbi:hypothetical protein BS17DRAFT_786436 [Gyrodon lividus]|nr:hypothetical protein BS17DRAFT_786436 [Gyrodon lividus]
MTTISHLSCPLPLGPIFQTSISMYCFFFPVTDHSLCLTQVTTHLSDIPRHVQQFPGLSFPIQRTHAYDHPNSHLFDSTHHEQSSQPFY